MEFIKVQRDQVIARKNDKVNYIYLIQEGSVQQKFDFSTVTLSRNAIIGILEKNIYFCDYVAAEDTVLAAFVCNNAEDLKKILSGQEKIRNIFLRAAIEQRHQLLCIYSDLYNKTRQFHSFIETAYNDYRSLCSKYKTELQNFSKMEHFNPLTMQHMAEPWEINQSVSLMKSYLTEYLNLMEKDDSLTVGAIMEAGAQMRRFALGIGEMEAYLSYNRDILMNETEHDLFSLYFTLSLQMHEKKYDITIITEKLTLIADFAEKLKIYNSRMVARRLRQAIQYDYRGEGAEHAAACRVEMDITTTDCVGHILEYAGYNDDAVEQISKQIHAYHALSDRLSSDKETYALRRQISAQFYEIYQKVFLRAVRDESSLTPILEMFLNFGFMDVSCLGEEYAHALYDLCAHLDICHSDHVYTIYEWLKCIYRGEKEPSKNEFDLNFAGYLAEQKKNGRLTPEQVKQAYQSREQRVLFEIQNMFTAVNKTTYGKITTFCPILNGEDIINSIEKMLVTAEKLETALNEVRKIDFSAFYREVPFSDPDKGINNDRVMKEVLPDIILMPNAGTKVMMWQETGDLKSDTPARIMFPILTAVDLDALMLEAIGRFRWEMCRRMQGVHWNDVREKSLTAEYCTYLQFYKKNHELSADAKEKLKSALVRAKNNYREVFVRDYINWIQFESKGSFRLNKISRDILVRYCPFVKTIRMDLKENPLYQNSIARYDTEAAKKLQRYQGVYNRYVKAGGTNLTSLKETLAYYEA